MVIGFAGGKFVLTIEDEPHMIGEQGEITDEDVELVKEWIRINKEKLIDIWNDDLWVFEANFTKVRCVSTTICLQRL